MQPRYHNAPLVRALATGVRIFAHSSDGLLSEIVQAANPYGLRDLAITETSLETVFIKRQWFLLSVGEHGNQGSLIHT